MNLTETEIQALESRLKLLIQKINKLKEALVLETDAARQFQYETQIAEEETEIQKIKNQLATAYNIHSSAGQSLFYQKLEALKLDFEVQLGILQMVNCNREDMKDHFWDAYDEKIKQPFQFYFISACQTQMPPSFAERMIYEMIIEELDEAEDALFRLRKEETDRVKIIDLPIGRNLRNCQRRFTEFFAKTFDFRQEESFEQFLKTGIPKLKYDAAALLFKVEESDWKEELIDYFQWLIEAFSVTHEDVPRFLFFIICYKKNLHKVTTELPLVKALNQLARENESATHLTPLNPVPVRDLKDWIRKLGETNESKVEEVIDLLIMGLRESDKQQYQKQKLLNMDDIERLQEIIYHIANR